MNNRVQDLATKTSVSTTDYVAVCRDTYTTADITAATASNPVVITAVDHGFVTGDQVFLTSIAGMTEINDQTFTITTISDDTFSLNSVDGSAYTAYTSGGKAICGRLQKVTVDSLRDGMNLAPTDRAVFGSVRTTYGMVQTTAGGALGYNTYFDNGSWRNVDTGQSGFVMRATSALFEMYSSSSGATPTLTLRGRLGTNLVWEGGIQAKGALTLGNNAVAETPAATHTLIIKDATGASYRVLATPV